MDLPWVQEDELSQQVDLPSCYFDGLLHRGEVMCAEFVFQLLLQLWTDLARYCWMQQLPTFQLLVFRLQLVL